MPVTVYTCRDTHDPAWALVTPLNFQSVKVSVSADRVQRARARMPKA